jgi:hypothetical protein
MRSPGTKGGSTRVVQALLWALLGFIPFLLVTSSHILSPDTYIYLSGAEGLAAGKGYRMLDVMPNKYPPLYSILVACGLWLPAAPMLVATTLNAALQALACLATYALLVPLEGRLHATLAAALVGLCNLNLVMVPEPSTHHLYLVVELAALAVAGRALRAERPARRDLLLLGALVGLAMSTRTAAVALVAGVVLAIAFLPRNRAPETATPRTLLERSRARAPLALAAVLGLTGAVVYSMALHGLGHPVKQAPKLVFEGVGYWDEMKAVSHDGGELRTIGVSDFLERLQRNAVLYAIAVGGILAPASRGWPVAALVLAGLAAIGFGRALLRAPTAIEWAIIPCAGMLLVYPAFGEPYLIPMTPFVFHYALKEAASLGLFLSRGRESVGQWAALTVWALVVAAQLGPNVLLVRQLRSPDPELTMYGPPVVEFIAASQWAREHLPREAVLVATRAPMSGYLARRPAYGTPLTTDPDEALAVLRELRVTHAIVAGIYRWTHMFLQPLVRARPEFFEPVHREGACTVYRIRWPRLPGR